MGWLYDPNTEAWHQNDDVASVFDPEVWGWGRPGTPEDNNQLVAQRNEASAKRAEEDRLLASAGLSSGTEEERAANLASLDPANSEWFQYIRPFIDQYGIHAVTNAVAAGKIRSPESFADFGTRPYEREWWGNYVASKQDNGDQTMQLLDRVVPMVAGTMVGGPLLGGALSTAATGGNLQDLAKNSALAYVGGQAVGATGLGEAVGGGTAGAVAEGGARGALVNQLQGKDAGEGALAGAVGGGVGASGVSDYIADTGAGALSGAATAAVTGRDVEQGALGGALSGAARDVSSAFAGGTSSGSDGSAAAAGGDDASGIDDILNDDAWLDDALNDDSFLNDGGGAPVTEGLQADSEAQNTSGNAGANGEQTMDDGFSYDPDTGDVQMSGGGGEDLIEPSFPSSTSDAEREPDFPSGALDRPDDGVGYEGDTTFGDTYDDSGAANSQYTAGGEQPEWLDKIKSLGSGAVTTLINAAKGDKAAIQKLAKLGLPTGMIEKINGGGAKTDSDALGTLAKIGIPAALLAGLFENTESPLTGVTKQGVQGALDQAGAYAATPTIGLTPAQKRAIELANTSVGAGKADLDRAGALSETAAGGITQDQIDRYTNPYIRGVLDPQLRDINEAAAKRRESLKAITSMSGNDLRTPSTDPNRFNVEDSMLDRETLRAISDASGKAYSDAWSGATSLAGKDLDRNLQSANVDMNLGKTRGALDTIDMANLNTAGALERLPEEDARTKAATASGLYAKAAGSAASAIPATTPKSKLTQIAGALGTAKTMKDIGLY